MTDNYMWTPNERFEALYENLQELVNVMDPRPDGNCFDRDYASIEVMDDSWQYGNESASPGLLLSNGRSSFRLPWSVVEQNIEAIEKTLARDLVALEDLEGDDMWQERWDEQMTFDLFDHLAWEWKQGVDE
jgi:hypothetical protein